MTRSKFEGQQIDSATTAKSGVVTTTTDSSAAVVSSDDVRIANLEQLLAKFTFPLTIPSVAGLILLTDALGKFQAAPFTTPVGERVNFYDDLSAQIDGLSDVFIVSSGVYTAGSLNVFVHGIGGMQKGVHFFEEDPASGLVRLARVLLLEDVPLIAQYKY